MKNESLDQTRLIRLWTLVVVRVLLLFICFAAVVWVLYMLSTVLLLLVLSIFFCYLIAPLVRLFEQPVYISGREIKLNRGMAILFVYALVGTVFFLAIRLMVPLLWEQVTELTKNLPSYIATGVSGVSRSLNNADSWMYHLNLPQEWRDGILQRTSQLAESIFPWLRDFVLGVLRHLVYLPWLILVPVISFFMLKDAADFERGLVALMPTERLQKRAHWLLLDVSRTLAAYIRAQITACVVVGVLVTVALAIIGVPYAVVLGFIAGVLEFVPMIGPLFAALIVFSLTLTTSFKLALIALLFLGILRIAQDYIIYPRIVGHGIKMHPLVVVIAVLAGAEIGGLSGVFLAIPFVGLFIVGYNHYVAYKGLEGTRPDVPGGQARETEMQEAHLASSGSSTPLFKE